MWIVYGDDPEFGYEVLSPEELPMIEVVSPVYTQTEFVDRLNEISAGVGDAVIDSMLDAIATGDKIARRIEYRFNQAGFIDTGHASTLDGLGYLVAICPEFTPEMKEKLCGGSTS